MWNNYDYPGLPAPVGTQATTVSYGATNTGLPGATDNPGNWLDDWITSYYTYPLPQGAAATGTGTPVVSVVPGTPAAPAAVAAAAAAAATPASQQQLPAAVPAVVAGGVAVLQRSYSYSPEFRGEGSRRAAGEHTTHDAPPVTFTVPAGCNGLDLLFGPIETSPGAQPRDFDHVVQTGKARVVNAVAGGELDQTKLTPGQQIAIIVPWRMATTAAVPAGHLRVELVAQFYAAAPATS